jgi:CelD/BcsL family acetyltransferase involved in cellulose biosynthesis
VFRTDEQRKIYHVRALEHRNMTPLAAAAASPPLAERPESDRRDPPRWQRQTVDLDFLLGEMHVYRVELPAMTVDMSVGLGDAATPAPALPDEVLQGDPAVALVRSLPTDEALPRLSWQAGFLRYVPSQYPRYYVSLAGTFEEYLAQFSGKTRNTLKRKVRKCGEAHGGDMVISEHHTRDEMRAFMDVARPLAARTYQTRLLGRGMPEDDAFVEEMLRLADAGQVRGYLLRLGGKPAAFLLCPIRNGCVVYDWLGYDPDCANLSPGTVLQYYALEKLFAERRHKLFDFTEGEGEHKEFWSRAHTRCADVYYFRPTPRNLALVAGHVALHGASRRAVEALDRLGVKDKLKRAMRLWKSRADAAPTPGAPP